MKQLNTKQVRIKLGINQVEFANLLGVHPVTVSKWERSIVKPNAWQASIIDAIGKSNVTTTKQLIASQGIPYTLGLLLNHL